MITLKFKINNANFIGLFFWIPAYTGMTWRKIHFLYFCCFC